MSENSTAESHTLRMALTLALVACAIAFATRRAFYFEALTDPFFGLALASLAILHLRLRCGWADIAGLAAGTTVFAVIDFGVVQYPFQRMALLSFFGVTSLLILGIPARCCGWRLCATRTISSGFLR